MSTIEGNPTPPRRPLAKPDWGAALAALDAQGAARDQAARARREQHNAMIRRTNLLAQMSEEERAAYLQAEAEAAAAE